MHTLLYSLTQSHSLSRTHTRVTPSLTHIQGKHGYYNRGRAGDRDHDKYDKDHDKYDDDHKEHKYPGKDHDKDDDKKPKYPGKKEVDPDEVCEFV